MSHASVRPKNSRPLVPSETQINEKEILVTLFMSESTRCMLNLNVPSEEGAHSSNSSEKSLRFRNNMIATTAYFNSNIDLNNSSNSMMDRKDQEDRSLQPTRVFTVINVQKKSDIKKSDEDSFSETKSYASGVSRLTPKTSLRNLGSNFCRICHGGKSFAELLSPCDCKGTIALAHLECLEHWLRESGNSHCELCQHHFQIIREPRYSIPKSILFFLKNPGERYGTEMIIDLVAFLFYTPLTVFSTYLLMLICENYTRVTLEEEKCVGAHLMVFASIFGMAAIDFTYSSWMMMLSQKYIEAWREWYRSNCNLKLILPLCKKEKDSISISSAQNGTERRGS